jgi:dTDP-glucose pyrophosphorylase
LGLFDTDRPEKFGMVQLGHDDHVLEIVDKPKDTHLSQMWGCIVWRPSFTDHLHSCVCQGVSDFALIINSAITRGMRVRGVRMSSGTYLDLGTYDEIVEMDRRFREK